MRKYESIVIFSQDLNDTDLKNEIKKFQNFIESNQGSVVSVEHWGRRELAFLMKKQKFGNYVCYRYDSENHDLSNKLTALLKITDSVIYSQSHKLNEKVRKVKFNPNRKPREGAEFESSFGDFDY